MKEILKLLEKDGRLSAQQIAAMLDMNVSAVESVIAKCEADRVILKYMTLVDWDKVSEDSVTALIEVKISPQRGEGFERIAERIYQYDEVDSLYLMSGAFDFAVYITAGRSRTWPSSSSRGSRRSTASRRRRRISYSRNTRKKAASSVCLRSRRRG
jgi:DNA-binding Lrp family transcriptional regulator